MSKILSKFSTSLLVGSVMALSTMAWPGNAAAEILPTTSDLGAPVGGTVLLEFSSDDSGARWLTFSGHLPRGLQVDPRPAGAGPIIVSGVPEEAGTFVFTVAVDSVH